MRGTELTMYLAGTEAERPLTKLGKALLYIYRFNPDIRLTKRYLFLNGSLKYIGSNSEKKNSNSMTNTTL
jgi:hypothetical protein